MRVWNFQRQTGALGKIAYHKCRCGMGIKAYGTRIRNHLFDSDGSPLEIPYTDDRELIQDILAWLPDVEVLAPKSLQARLNEI